MIVNYDQLADQYRTYRHPDPRIAARIHSHLQGKHRVLNVGAGIGSYEPEDCEVVAIEPSHEMIAKRDNSQSILIQGFAEDLPFVDNSFDAAMAVLAIHHWSDITSGLKEMLRVSKYKIMLFTWNGYGGDLWLEDYIPEIIGVDIKLFPTLKELKQILGGISVENIEIPYDCTDGFMCAYWRRPESYLDLHVRKAISTFSRISDIQSGINRLQGDIASGTWHKKYSNLLDKESLDLGYRLVICDKQNKSLTKNCT